MIYAKPTPMSWNDRIVFSDEASNLQRQLLEEANEIAKFNSVLIAIKRLKGQANENI